MAGENSQEQPKRQQLQMLWPERLLDAPPITRVPAGYTLRTYRPGDEPGFYRVMALAGFEGWNEETLQPWMSRILPDGWFVVVHNATGDNVATAMATHNPSHLHPFGGELGWVAGHPEHAGKGLGILVCAAVTARFLQAGYTRIYLKTDDWRLPALKTYFKLGYIPFLHTPDMRDRWRVTCELLPWPYTPNEWPAVDGV